MVEPAAVLIAAASGRALAASARRAGYAPLAVDFFADDDTREVAESCVRLEDGVARGFQLHSLMAACERLAEGRTLAGVVYGSGFEDRPALIEAMAKRWRLIGNPASIVSRLKDPLIFADLCREVAVPHPETRLERPADPWRWLARRRGGSGGGHIRPAEAEPAADAETYFQRRVDGRPVSALVLADGARCAILGFSEQWAQEGRCFRFAGAAQPAAIPVSVEQALAAAVGQFCARTPLVGLNSLIFWRPNGRLLAARGQPPPRRDARHFRTRARAVAVCAPRRSLPGRAGAGAASRTRQRDANRLCALRNCQHAEVCVAAVGQGPSARGQCCGRGRPLLHRRGRRRDGGGCAA